MASIVERPRKGGSTFQVKWREGGGRDGKGQSERFGDRSQAEAFKRLVDAHGQHWPRGWVKGRGFVEEEQQPGDMPLVVWAHRYVDRLTGIDERVRHGYRRDVDVHLSLLQHTEASGRVVDATIGNLTADDVRDWVRVQQAGARDPEDPERWVRRPAAPKSIANRHGLLSCVVQAAVEAEQPLRTRNCCKGTRLPRQDDHIAEEMCFLEGDEYNRVAEEIRDSNARDLADWLVGTGMRWGEATGLQVRDIDLARGTASVQRAWKRRAPNEDGPSYYLGPPKTKKARRVVALTPEQLAMLRRRITGGRPESLVFTTQQGKAWRHVNFWRRQWRPAVEEAIAKGLTKRPRIHDLRHTHVSWLIAKRIPLPAIQVRLGHESITTTVDRYGHLVRELDAEITAAVSQVLGGTAPSGDGTVVPLRESR